MPGDRGAPAEFVIGSVVAVTFGTVFVLVNSGGLPDPWPLVLGASGLLVAVLLMAGVVLVTRRAPRATQARVSGFADRRYWLVVALEAGVLFGGLLFVNGVLHHAAASVAWVALVVGVHFVALGRIWRSPLYQWLGVTVTMLGVIGFLIFTLDGSAATVALVTGVGSGAALYAAVAVALRDALRRTFGAD